MSQQSNKIKKSLLFVVIFSILILVTPVVWGSCGVQEIMINENLKQYDLGMEPDSCASLVNQIIEFNDDCDSEIEIVDCG